ncbi:MAG: molybdopterin synthase sulfur carrier subunit [Gammaproteobacteria bacterium]|nr:molybdopterin synthase sulfur carrier subunit [Gammaproteobacteria bacterium]
MIDVRFFASVRETLGLESTQVDAEGVGSVADVINALIVRDEAFREALGQENMLVSVNQVMVKPDTPVRAGDEVAFFPPVTGG